MVIHIRWKNWFYCNSIVWGHIAINFCTCHDGTIVVSCAEFHSDNFNATWTKTEWNFRWICITMTNHWMKLAPYERIYIMQIFLSCEYYFSSGMTFSMWSIRWDPPPPPTHTHTPPFTPPPPLLLSFPPHHPTPYTHAHPLLLALCVCAGNSPVTDEFPSQMAVMRCFDVFVDLRLNKRFSKQSWGWWYETPSRPLWRHCNGILVDH